MGRRQWGLLGKHQLMICKIFLLGLAGLALAGEPGVFDNYFDDTIKEVDISLDIAIKGCLQNGDTFADKVRKAYGDCFGSADYSFGELAANEGGKDSDNDGLPDSFEGNEKCFYKKIGWVDGAGNLSPDAIKGDLAGLGSGEKAEFDDNIDKCANWNGDFSSRRKRDVGENETEEEVSNVPFVMESGSSALGWLKAAVRKVRSAEPGNDGNNGKKKKGRNAKKNKGRNGRKKPSRKRNGSNKKKGRNAKKKSRNGRKKQSKKRNGRKKKKGRNSKKKGGRNGRKKQSKKRNGRKKKKNRNSKKKDGRSGRKNGNGKKNNNTDKKNPKKDNNGGGGKKGGKSNGNSGANNRNNNGMGESTYNKLWCFDLSLEQILQKCVENKIKN